MHQYDGPVPREHYVRRARKIAAMQPEAVPEPVKRATHKNFGLGVLRPELRHHLSTGRVVEHIPSRLHHSEIVSDLRIFKS